MIDRWEEFTVSKRLGALRPSQVITSFGPGSIVDLTKDSVMVLGIDSWRPGDSIHEYRLEQLLGVDEFKSPGTGREQGIPVRSFPLWRVCPRCDALSDRFPRPPGKAVPVCNRCRSAAETHPARFIVACERGHVSDFPWVRWAHRGKSICPEPLLTLRSKGRTGGLSDLEVICRCGAKQSMLGALGPKGLASLIDKCPGHRPWLGDTEDNCDGQIRGLQRGASNSYFPVITSGLSIPPFVGSVQKELDGYWPTVKKMAEVSPDMLETLISSLFPAVRIREALEAVHMRLQRDSTKELREEEWLTLRSAGTGIKYDDEFDAKEVDVPTEYATWIERVVLVRRLREVRVLRGFTRIDPPDPEQSDRKRLAYLSSPRQNWLPAVEVRGEGVFLELKRSTLQGWEQLESVKARTRDILKAYEQWRLSVGWPEITRPLPRHILLHTLAHLLIRQLSLDAGYASASIRERLYVSSTMSGLLLYTAAPGADGSLGGLVHQGEPARLKMLLSGAIENAAVCSSDPLCREHKPSEVTGVNGAACHACALVPETACERANRLLDRACVVDLPEMYGTGFFSWDGIAR